MKNQPVHERVNLIVSCFMAIIYLGGGIFLISSSYSFGFFEPGTWQNTLLAVVLIAYGLFRAQRAFRIYRNISEK